MQVADTKLMDVQLLFDESLNELEMCEIKGGFQDQNLSLDSINNGTGCGCQQDRIPINNGNGCGC
jgi:hypothetical protein